MDNELLIGPIARSVYETFQNNPMSIALQTFHMFNTIWNILVPSSTLAFAVNKIAIDSLLTHSFPTN